VARVINFVRSGFCFDNWTHLACALFTQEKSEQDLACHSALFYIPYIRAALFKEGWHFHFSSYDLRGHSVAIIK